MKIRLFLSGGTIDKHYDGLSGKLEFSTTHMPEMLERARNRTDITIEELMLVDSLDMTEAQREKIVRACKSASEELIIISHGTDTIVKTAEEIAKVVHDKTIVLFGAMVPYSLKGSDALFNLGAAVIAVQTMPAGTYVVMNGKVFPCDKVTKNKVLGEFETKN